MSDIYMDQTPLPQGFHDRSSVANSYISNIFKINSFVEAAMPKDSSKAFSKNEAFDAFESYIFNDSREMDNNASEGIKFLGFNIGKKKEVNGFTKEEAESIRGCLGVFEKYANSFKDGRVEEFRSEYNSKGRGALVKFLVKAEEAGVSGDDLMVSLAVIGNIGGFEVDFKNVEKSMFKKQKNEDFVKTAKEIILKTTSLPENKTTVTYKEGFDELDDAMALENAVSSERSLGSGSRGTNNKLVNVETVFDTHGPDKIMSGTRKTLQSDDFDLEPSKQSISKKRKNN